MTAAAGWLVVTLLFAAPSEVVSRAHFVKAERLFAQHDWRRALDEFTAASESAPTELAELSFDIAQCHRNLGHARQAVLAYEHYLALKPDAADKLKVRALIAQLGGHAAPPAASPEDASSPAPEATSPSPSANSDAPAAAGLSAAEVAPATPSAPSQPAAVPSLAAPASSDARLTASPAPPPARARRRWPVWTAVAAGLALTAVAVGVGVGVGVGSSGGHGATPPTALPPPMLGSAGTFDTRGH